MRGGRFMAVCASAIVLAGAVASPAPALADGSTTATAGGTTVTVAIPDVTFEGPNCMNAPVQATFTDIDTFATVHLSAAIAGSNNALSLSVLANDDGTVRDTFQICPTVDSPGVYSTIGTLNTAVAAAQLPATTFTVSKATTTFTALAATVRGRVLSVAGAVRAKTGSKTVGAGGIVKIYGFLSKARGGSGAWQVIGQVSPNASGAFRASGATTRRLSGAFIRAVLVPASWCTGSRSTVRVVTTRP